FADFRIPGGYSGVHRNHFTENTMKNWLLAATLTIVGLQGATQGADDKDNTPPPGFTALFNGKDLENWQGLIEINTRAKMTPEQRKKAQETADAKILPHWTVKDGILNYDGKGNNLQTVKDYGNFELYV